jgi:hypothetical protein
MKKGPPRPRRNKKTIREIQQHFTEGSVHEWEWPENRMGICVHCGLVLHLIVARKDGSPERGLLSKDKWGNITDGGWLTKAVWGGNEYGIGGLLYEPPCR